MLLRAARCLIQFLRDEDGPTAVEYAVLLVAIIFVCLLAITGIGAATQNNFNQLNTNLSGS